MKKEEPKWVNDYNSTAPEVTNKRMCEILSSNTVIDKEKVEKILSLTRHFTSNCPDSANDNKNTMIYFIEKKDTNEWFYSLYEQKYSNTSNGSRIATYKKHIPSWTKDPNKASKFETIQQAEFWIKIYGLEDVEVTEHEFVNSKPTPSESSDKGLEEIPKGLWVTFSELDKYKNEIHNKTVQQCIDKINTFATVDITVKFWISELEKLKR